MRPFITAQSIGWIYLLHMARPLGNLANARAQAQHYIGFATDLEERVAEHLAGYGAKITRAAVAQGIEISLVAAWQAPLSFEKRLKARKEAPRLCPICCRRYGRKVKQVLVVEQLTLPHFEEPCSEGVEPWPAGFEFEPPEQLRPVWAEIAAEQQARRMYLAPPHSDDWDDGLV